MNSPQPSSTSSLPSGKPHHSTLGAGPPPISLHLFQELLSTPCEKQARAQGCPHQPAAITVIGLQTGSDQRRAHQRQYRHLTAAPVYNMVLHLATPALESSNPGPASTGFGASRRSLKLSCLTLLTYTYYAGVLWSKSSHVKALTIMPGQVEMFKMLVIYVIVIVIIIVYDYCSYQSCNTLKVSVLVD